MTTSTYRLHVSGQFAALTPAVAPSFAPNSLTHGVFGSAFTLRGRSAMPQA